MSAATTIPTRPPATRRPAKAQYPAAKPSKSQVAQPAEPSPAAARPASSRRGTPSQTAGTRTAHVAADRKKTSSVSPTPTRYSPRATAAITALWAWLRHGPASCGLLALLAAASLLPGGSVPAGPATLLAADVTRPGRLWTLLTAWAGSTWTTSLIGAVLLLTVAIWVERTLGSHRFLGCALITHFIGVGTALVLYPPVSTVWPSWGAAMTQHRIGGVALLVAGPLLAATARMELAWRRRVRILVPTALTVGVVTGGSATEVVCLAAAVTGLIIGAAAWQEEGPVSRLVCTHRSARNRTALVVAVWAIIMALATVSKAAVGPLSAMRSGIMPSDAALSGAGATVLTLMPLFGQLVLADGLRRGRRAAALGTIALQGFLVVCAAVSLLGGRLADAAPARAGWGHAILPLVFSLVLILLIVWNRQHLRLHTRPGVIRRTVLAWLGVVAVGAAGALLLGLLAADGFTPQATPVGLLTGYLIHLLPSSALPALVTTPAPASLAAHVAVEWLPVAVWIGTIACVWTALRRPAVTVSARREDLGALVRAHGAGTLGWMLTWPGNEAWIAPNGDAGFAYRAGGGVALSLGDPAATPAEVGDAVDAFAAFAADAGLTPALYSVHEPTMRAARSRGWTVLQVAEEAVLDLEGLAFRGKAFQDVRTALNHARRESITAQWTTWGSAPAGWRDQIRAISQRWAADQALPEMGFTLGGLDELDDTDTRLLLAVDAEGTVHAVTSWLPVHRDGEVIGLTLDVMRRRKDGWRPAIEFLIARAAQDAQAEGLELLSLSGAPLARSGETTCPGAAAARLNPVLDLLAAVLEPAYGFTSLHAFKRKFQPRAVPMYLAVPEVIDLPAAGLAIAHAYLPGLTPAQAARFAQVLISHE